MDDRTVSFKEELDRHQQTLKARIISLFQEVGDHYQQQSYATLELHAPHDVHTYYRLTQEPSKVVHVQGYPGLSSNDKATVSARSLNYNDMMGIRIDKNGKVGNEHEATIYKFPNFPDGSDIPYDAAVLEEKIANNLGWKKIGHGKVTVYEFQTGDGILYVELHKNRQDFNGCDILEVGIRGQDRYMFSRDTFEQQGDWGDFRISDSKIDLIWRHIPRINCTPNDEIRDLMNLQELVKRII